MKVGDFINVCAANFNDEKFLVTSQDTWQKIVSFEALSLLPDIKIKKKSLRM